MPSKLSYGAGTNVGLVRTNNEDCYLAEPDYGLWLIADGMGGHDAGEVASSIVKDSVFNSVKNGIPLKDAISRSHTDVKDAAAKNIGSPNMGTTIVALLTNDSSYEIAWVGDSRAYLWDPLTQNFTQLSKDHSYVQALVDSGAITEEEMHTHAQKNIITQSLGVSELESVEVDVVTGSWGTRQQILLCSDGLTDLVSDEEIATFFKKHHSKTNQELVNSLISVALEKGGIDNVSVEVISAPQNLNELNEKKGSPLADNKWALFGLSALILAVLIYSFI